MVLSNLSILLAKGCSSPSFPTYFFISSWINDVPLKSSLCMMDCIFEFLNVNGEFSIFEIGSPGLGMGRPSGESRVRLKYHVHAWQVLENRKVMTLFGDIKAFSLLNLSFYNKAVQSGNALDYVSSFFDWGAQRFPKNSPFWLHQTKWHFNFNAALRCIEVGCIILLFQPMCASIDANKPLCAIVCTISYQNISTNYGYENFLQWSLKKGTKVTTVAWPWHTDVSELTQMIRHCLYIDSIRLVLTWKEGPDIAIFLGWCLNE